MSRIADSFGFDIFRHQQDLKYAQTPQERTEIGNRIENSQARLETTGMVVQTYAYGTAAAGLAPWVAIGGAYAAPYVGGALASGYGSYSTWFAGTTLSSYISTAGYSGLFFQSSLRVGSFSSLWSMGGDYLSGGEFNFNNVDFNKATAAFVFKGLGGNFISSSFQSDTEGGGGIRPSTLSEFSLEFSFNKASGTLGGKIDDFGLSKFSQSMGTYFESVLQIGNNATFNTVRNEVKKEIEN